MVPDKLSPEHGELLDVWVRAVEAKDMDGLANVFRQDEHLTVCWSNGERSQGWDQVRRHIEKDFRQEVGLSMRLHDVATIRLGEDGAVLTYGYEITVRAGEESVTCPRHASMTVYRDPEGWRVAALHVSTLPAPAGHAA